MARVVKDRGASGHDDNILFRQNLDYPKEPGQITYYPPEPSEELQKQVRKDKAGGLALYIIGFAVAIIGLFGAMEFSQAITIYATLIPLLLILGLIFAIMYLVLDNVALALIARALPLILMICLVLLYILSIFMAVMDMSSLIDGGNQNNISAAFENIFSALLNPAFFFMLVGLMICRAGGTMLWTSTKVVHQYIPGMIIIETPKAPEVVVGEAPQTVVSPETGVVISPEGEESEEYVDEKPDPEHPCQSCSQPMTYIPPYERYYCYDCGTYGTKDEPSSEDANDEPSE